MLLMLIIHTVVTSIVALKYNVTALAVFNTSVCPCTQTESPGKYRPTFRLIYEISVHPNNLNCQSAAT